MAGPHITSQSPESCDVPVSPSVGLGNLAKKVIETCRHHTAGLLATLAMATVGTAPALAQQGAVAGPTTSASASVVNPEEYGQKMYGGKKVSEIAKMSDDELEKFMASLDRSTRKRAISDTQIYQDNLIKGKETIEKGLDAALINGVNELLRIWNQIKENNPNARPPDYLLSSVQTALKSNLPPEAKARLRETFEPYLKT